MPRFPPALVALALGCTEAPPPARSPSLEAIAQRLLPDPSDAAAIMRLPGGELVLSHHWSVLSKRRIMPGSVMKLVSAYALATADRDDIHRCAGTHRAPDGTERVCWFRPGHGALRLRAALAQSCNVWFYASAAELEPMDWRNALQAFGFGAPWDGARIARDHVPADIPKRDLPDLMVGDHPSLRVTPLSVLRAVSVIAQTGTMSTPARSSAGPAARTVDVDRDAIRLVAEGMVAAVDHGTLANVFSPGRVAAKTGTAKRFRALGTRGWVVGFAPRDGPRFVFVVVKDGGRGRADAGPVAAALVRALPPR